MGVCALVVMDDVHLRVVLQAIDGVFAWGMQANLHGPKLRNLSLRELQIVLPIVNFMLEIGHLYHVFG